MNWSGQLEEFSANSPKLFHVILFFFILFISYIVSRGVRALFVKFLEGRQLHRTDPTYVNFLKNVSQGAILLVGFGLAIYAIPPLRALSVSLLASAGILAAILGLAAQQTFSNFISGVFIVLFKPIRVNDYVEIDGGRYFGTVEDITLRHTVIRNVQGVRVVIPNSFLSTVVVVNYNLVDVHVCALVEILVEYGQDLDEITKIIQDTAMEHPLVADRRTEEEISNGIHPVRVRVMRANERGILFRAQIWGENPDEAFDIRTECTKNIIMNLSKKGIKLSYINIPTTM